MPRFFYGPSSLPRQCWLPSYWQWRASSLFASSRSLRTNAHGQDLLQVFASYGLCSKNLWTSGKTLSIWCSQPQSGNSTLRLSGTSGDGSRVEKVVDLRFPRGCRTWFTSPYLQIDLKQLCFRQVYRNCFFVYLPPYLLSHPTAEGHKSPGPCRWNRNNEIG